MEGILEKPSRIPGRKTKVWSILDETTLSFFQENKRSLCIGSVDLADIQLVKIVSDCQFEITTDINSQIYTTISKEKCKQWVQELSKFSKGDSDTKESNLQESLNVNKTTDKNVEHTVEVKTARNIFESKSAKPGVSKKKGKPSREVVSVNITEHKENAQTFRRSDPTKNHSWSTIADARSHLHHVSIDKPDISSSSGNGKLVESCVNSGVNSNFRDMNKHSDNIQNKLKSEQSKLQKQTEDEGNGVEKSSGVSSGKHNGLNINDKGEKRNSKDPVQACNIPTKITNAMSENLKSDFLQNENLDLLKRKSKELNEQVSSDNRPDSGYGTTTGENSRNSQENKVDAVIVPETITETIDRTEEDSDISSESGKTFEESERGSISVVSNERISENFSETVPLHEKISSNIFQQTKDSEETKSEIVSESPKTFGESKQSAVSPETTATPNDGDDEAKPEETIVVLRKTRSRVSVSTDNKVSVIEDVQPNEILTFPNIRKNKLISKPSIEEHYENQPDTPPQSMVKPKFTLHQDSTEDVEPVQSFRGDHLDGRDEVSGASDNKHPKEEIVENYLSIDAIMNKANFPNIPSLPNNTPKQSDLISLNKLKQMLEKLDSDDEYSDTDCGEDPILELSRLVEI